MSKDERIETGMSKPALNISLWVAQALLFLVFAGGGVWKIVTPLHEIEAMMSWVGEVPPPFFYATAALDLLGGLGLLLPSLTRIKPELTHWAALGCAALMLGAALFTWTVVLYGLAYWAERSGAIGGIPTLLLAQIVFVHLKLWIGDESPSISSLLVQMGGVAFALPLLIGPDELIKRTPSEGATRQELLFPWLVAGMIPVTLAMAFLGWPALISAWLGASSPMREVTALLSPTQQRKVASLEPEICIWVT